SAAAVPAGSGAGPTTASRRGPQAASPTISARRTGMAGRGDAGRQQDMRTDLRTETDRGVYPFPATAVRPDRSRSGDPGEPVRTPGSPGREDPGAAGRKARPVPAAAASG